MKKLIYCIVVLTLISCRANKTLDKIKINIKPNKEYYKSRKSFYGELNNSEYKEIKNALEKELNTIIPIGKSILINYNQRANNCISSGYNSKSIQTVTDNRIRISSRICSNNNTIGFFVFSKDTFHKDFYLKKENFILDTGFFNSTIFTLHENCESFFILKANGTFLKFYGEDYYSEVSSFLEKE